MSTKAVAKKFSRPDATLRAARTNAEQKEPRSRITKSFTSFGVRRAAGEGDEAAPSVYRPTDAQLQAINQYTRTPKTADEVACFDTWSCNDQLDRDLDAFTTDTVKGFAALEPPFGPDGKSFMVGHDYTKLPVGRIFSTDTASNNGALFLVNGVYIPNTAQNANFLESVDFGIYWAVSVGVVLEESNCSVCGQHMYRFGFCDGGHIKGEWYPEGDPGSETSWPEPVPAGSKGAEMCTGELKGAKDFYELSQVFLGSQVGAELQRNPQLAGVMKAAKSVPLLGLSADEAGAIPLPRLPERYREAVIAHSAQADDDGSATWTDDQGLVWLFDPEDSEVRCLGKQADAPADGEDDDEEASGGEGDHEQGRGQPAEDADALGADDAGEQQPAGGAELDGGVGEDGAGAVADEEVGRGVGAVAAARAAGLPEEHVAAAARGLSALLRAVRTTLDDNATKIAELTGKAAIGDEYLKALRADAINWYVRARVAPGQQGVTTASYERILDALGNDVELLRAEIEEQKAMAQLRFPETVGVRRSSEPVVPDERNELEPIEASDPELDKRVSRLH